MTQYQKLETKIREVIDQLHAVRNENNILKRENKRLESQCSLLEEENISARRLITHNNTLTMKHKRAKERAQRLWEMISQAL
ncbi:MAG: hypothetical protein GF384_00310 [Elusimicrobia bacterium]|nr:hypothetical protein [Elusimicrobiota bacterium]MBD3411538.1 hypothetical protein [Elusimicrobiota bacterium]